jgi:hypothetical protein
MFPTIAAYTRLEAWRLARLEGRLTNDRSLNGRGHPTPEYAFKVKLSAVVRVRAANETVAR